MNDLELLTLMTTYYMAGAFMMFIMMGLLNHFHRRTYLMTWALSWAVLLMGYFLLFYAYTFEVSVFLVLYGVFILTGVFLHQRGAYMFLDKPYPKSRVYAYALMLIISAGLYWTPLQNGIFFSVFFFAGLLYLDASRIFLKTQRRMFFAYGVVLAVQGLLIMALPLLDVDFTLGTILHTIFLLFGMAAAYGMVGVHLIREHDREKALQERLYHLSFHDHLTGLKNRAYLETFLNTLDENDTVEAAVLMSDLDTLKVINDRHGHAAGDAMIIRASEVLAQAAESSDIIVRYGGDEFVIVFANRAKENMEKTVAIIRERTDKETVQGIPLSFSVGYAVHDNDRSIYDTLRTAEKMMYHNKRTKTKSRAPSDWTNQS